MAPPPAGAVDRVLIDNTYSTTGATAGWVTSQVTEEGDSISFAYQSVSTDGVAAQTVVTAGVPGDPPTPDDDVESFTYVHEAVGQLGGVTTDSTGATSQSWSEHLLTQYESRRGGRTTAAYDEDTASGRLPTGVIEALGAPDPSTPNTAVAGDVYTYCQDEPGGTDGDTRLRSHTDAAGVETRYAYGPDPVTSPCYGDLVADRVPTQVVVDPGGINAVTTVTSTNGLIETVVDPDGVVTEYGWDPTSRRLLWSAEDLDGDAVAEATTWYGYDTAGRLVVTRSPEGDESWTVYDLAGRVDLSYVTIPNPARGCASRTACDFSAGVPAGTPVASDATYTADGRHAGHGGCGGRGDDPCAVLAGRRWTNRRDGGSAA